MFVHAHTFLLYSWQTQTSSCGGKTNPVHLFIYLTHLCLMQVWRLGVLQTWQLHRLEAKKIPDLGPDSTSQPHLLLPPLPAHSHLQRGSSLRLFPPVWMVFKRKTSVYIHEKKSHRLQMFGDAGNDIMCIGIKLLDTEMKWLADLRFTSPCTNQTSTVIHIHITSVFCVDCHYSP